MEQIAIPAWPQADEREAELLRAVLESPQWGGFHPFVEKLESSFAAFQGCRFGVSAFNGTVTLEALLEVLGVGAGDEVIVPAISFVSTATAVSRRGAIPVFVDIERETFNIDPRQVRRAITPRTRAVMAVHFGGTMCDVSALAEICREHQLRLIEDAAHAQGSEWDGQRAGSFGAAGSFSFQNGKVLSAGEGGMLVTSDGDLAGRLRSLANCGRASGRSFYDHPTLGTNLRMSGFQAAVLLAQLERLPAQIALRTRNARTLRDALGPIMPAAIAWQKQSPRNTENSCYLLVGRACTPDLRDEVCRLLSGAGVPCTAFYPHTLYKNELYRQHPCRVLPCPVAEQSVRDSFWLPHRVLLADAGAIGQMAELMRRACEQAEHARR